ncbi:bifunctional riboflavin kinase/FAD synthetase [Microbacterium sp. NC79]|uniref:bifunctional riboflavin kinase/FAD synthetase n=1 Tax=Microbacterium sp. NC79 TaxID=2851009 RepID=UPI001C2BEF11|nr:bifunctional riboflavin kinase/FAD synthetase [Microbacterium sp. NC79]MBV0895268.1 bifunctional riboflavin kinase/FAD synthetase [Microbacterium sp. NC79]
MIVFTDPNEIPADFGPSVVAIGKFDGVHTGHRLVLEKAIADARTQGAKTVAVTFDRNPLAILRPELCPTELVSLAQKIELLGGTGIDAVLVLTFDEAMARVPAEEFVERILVGTLHAKTVLVGHDFRFGHRGAGDPELLRRMGTVFGFTVDAVGDVTDAGDRVSSTRIRELLAEGDVAAAGRLLGRPHAVEGEVVHGLKRGRELGFPTANLSPQSQGDVPADGVYAGWLRAADGVHRRAAISVGINPTFDDVEMRQVEAYVLDETDLDLYGQHVVVEFVDRIRGMVAFRGIPALIEQMTDDVTRTREILS